MLLLVVLLTSALFVVAFSSKALVAEEPGAGAGAAGPGAGAGSGTAPATTVPAPPNSATSAQGSLGILLGGDLLLDLEPGQILSREGPTALLRGWAELRWGGDIDLGLANLECPLSDRGQPLPGKLYTFRGDPEDGGEGLRWLGFDGVSLANNHILDYGPDALADTLAVLSRYGIAAAGAGADITRAMAPVIFERDGIRIALLAFGGTEYMPPQYRDWWAATQTSPGIAPLAPEPQLLAAVRSAREGADLVVVSLHWGIEYADVTSQQRALGRAVIEAGADIVFGHHPHVPQPVEVYNGRPIIYSLGNLAFHPFQEQARHMLAAEVRVETDAAGKPVPVMVRLHPLYNQGGRTVRTPGELAGGFLANIAQRSRALGTDCAVDGQTIAIPLR